jgi:hypothetical protein
MEAVNGREAEMLTVTPPLTTTEMSLPVIGMGLVVETGAPLRTMPTVPEIGRVD